MKEETKATKKTGGEEISGCEENPAIIANSTKPEAEQPFDCRKRCMHCGTHCIYLNRKQEE